MNIIIREYKPEDIPRMTEIWNEVVNEGIAFPQNTPLDFISSIEFFESQTYVGVAEGDGKILGLYILHPNNVGRCGHIANASYCVSSASRGNHIGEKLVTDSLKMGKEKGFRILQFNAVVKTNESALHLYKKLGFVRLGTIPQGFYMPDGHFEDIIPHYHML